MKRVFPYQLLFTFQIQIQTVLLSADLTFTSTVEMKVYCKLMCEATYAWICVEHFPVSLTGPWCQLMSVSVSVNVKDAVVIHPHHGGMTLFVTVVTDSASLRGACASAVSERLSLCFTHTHTHRHTQTHCWNWQQRRAYPIVGGIRLGYRKNS